MYKDMYTIENQNKLRCDVEQYLKNNGIKQRWLCEQMNIHETRFSHWKKGRENLSDDNYLKLLDFIKNKGEINVIP